MITKEVDKSSPLLYNSMVTNEIIAEWELQFWSPASATPGAGHEVQSHTVKPLNANIASIDFQMLNNKNPDLKRYAEYEEIAFTYQKISWIWNDGGIRHPTIGKLACSLNSTGRYFVRCLLDREDVNCPVSHAMKTDMRVAQILYIAAL